MGEVHSIPQGEGGEHRYSDVWANIGIECSRGRFGREKDCSRIWTTSTWFANQTGWEQSTTSSVSFCGTNAESPSMQARPRCGTKVAPDCARLQRTATDVSPEVVVWRGDALRPATLSTPPPPPKKNTDCLPRCRS